MSKKFLLVDDDLYIRELYEEILTGEGYEVETVDNGKDGYELIAANQYDLILLDVMLPQLDGIGVLTKLRDDNVKLSCPVVLITNLAHDPAVKDALSLGAHSVITKAELNPDELVAKIKAALGEKTAPEKKDSPAAEVSPEAKEPSQTEPKPESEAQPEAESVQEAQPKAETKPTTASQEEKAAS